MKNQPPRQLAHWGAIRAALETNAASSTARPHSLRALQKGKLICGVLFCVVSLLRLRAESPAGAAASEATLHSVLTDSIQAHVKGKLAAYEYPREVEFIDALPMTTTGKVIRKDLKAKHIRDFPIPARKCCS